MALIELKLDPTRRELRLFGAVFFPAFFAIVAAAVWKVWGSLLVAAMIFGTALCISIIGLMHVPFMRMVYVSWMYAAYPIGWTVSHVMLGSLYYLVITPVSLIMKLVGRDPLKRQLDGSVESYWIPRKHAEGVERYFRQF